MNARAKHLVQWAGSLILLMVAVLAGRAGDGAAAPQAVLYDQTDSGAGGWIGSTNFLNNVAYDSLDSQGADDFQVPADKFWQVSTVTVHGLYTGDSGTPYVQSMLIQIYSNSGSNLPALLLYSTTIAAGQISGLESGTFVMNLPSAVTLGPGRHWLSVQANKQVDGESGYQWHWRERAVQSFSPSAWRNPGDGYATGCTTFQSRLSECDHPGLSTNPDLLFKLEGATVDITGQIFFPILLR